MVGRRPSGSRQGATATVVAGLTVLALAAAGCTVRVRPEPTTTTTLPRGVAPATTTAITGPVTHGTTVASRAFTLVRGQDRTRVGPAAPGPLPLAMRGTVESIDEAVGLVLVFPLLRAGPSCVRQLELWLRVLRLDHEPDLSAYPSSLVSPASARSLDRTVPRGTPLVVDVRASGNVLPLFEARLAPIGGDRSTAPHLRWTVARDC